MKSTMIFLSLLLFGTAASIDLSAAGRAANAAAATARLAWSADPFAWAGLAMLGILFLCRHLYFLAKRWRLRADMEERAHLAHEMHDALAQSFAGIGFQLQAIRNSVPPNSSALERQVDLAMELASLSSSQTPRPLRTARRPVCKLDTVRE